MRITSSVPGQLDVVGLSSDEIGIRAAKAGLTLYELFVVEPSLEEAFMELTGDAVEYRAPSTSHEENAA